MSSSLERASHDFYVPADGAFTTSLVEEELEPDIKRTGSFEIARQFQEARISISKSNRTGTATEEDEKFNKLRHIDEHIIPLEDLLARYDSDPSNVRTLLFLLHSPPFCLPLPSSLSSTNEDKKKKKKSSKRKTSGKTM